MTTDCSLNYIFNTLKFLAQKIGKHVVYRNSFWHSDNLCTQHVLPMFCKNKSFWQRFTCTGINQEKKLLYLKTALNDQELSSINCLTSGSMLVPNGYFLKKAKPGHPYVQAKPNLETPLNIPWQRSAKPRLQEFQQQQNNKWTEINHTWLY